MRYVSMAQITSFELEFGIPSNVNIGLATTANTYTHNISNNFAFICTRTHTERERERARDCFIENFACKRTKLRLFLFLWKISIYLSNVKCQYLNHHPQNLVQINVPPHTLPFATPQCIYAQYSHLRSHRERAMWAKSLCWKCSWHTYWIFEIKKKKEHWKGKRWKLNNNH